MPRLWTFLVAVVASAQSPGSVTERLASETRLPGVISIQALATDAAGNLYATGGAAPSGLPLVNALRAANTGMQIAASSNGGAHWTPLANLASSQVHALAVHPTEPDTVYAGATGGLYRSIDGGITWTLVLAGGVSSRVCCVAIHPRQPGTVYAFVDGAGVFKSTDGGSTWTPANQGLAGLRGTVYLSFLVMDPFHPETLIAGQGNHGFRTDDGGASWQPADLASPPNLDRGAEYPLVTFDPLRPDVAYSFAGFYLARSADRGRNWTALSVPGGTVFAVTPDPVTQGVLYVGTQAGLLRSNDDGQTWENVGLPAVAFGWIAIDPADPAVILAFGYNGGWRTADRGRTWQRLTLSRRVSAAVFDGRGRAWVATVRSNDGFLMKRSPSGEVLFSSYLGGQGEDGPSALAVDGGGYVYVAGSTYSVDFPVTPGAAQTAFAGGTDGFVMKVSPAGAVVWATYLGGSGEDRVSAVQVDREGNVFVSGSTYSPPPGAAGAFVAKIVADGSRVVYTTYLAGPGSSASGLAVDSTGNVWVVAGGYSFLAQIAPDGTIAYTRYLSGIATAVALDTAGNIYVAGNTSSKDFRTTEGAYQTQLHADCPYPSALIPTGLIGTISIYQMDDIFVMKLDPSGTSLAWSTLLGGNCYDTARSIAVAPDGSVFVAGATNSSPFPTLYPVESGPPYSAYKPVLAHLDPSGSALLFSTHFGFGQSAVLALDPAGDVYAGGSGGYLARFTASSAPPLSLNAVGNAFSRGGGPVSPGEIVGLSVAGLAPEQEVDLGLSPPAPLPDSLADTRVLFDGTPVPLVSVSRARVVALAPFGLKPGQPAMVEVEHRGVRSNAVRVDVRDFDLGLLSTDSSGTGRAYVRNEDGTLNGPGNPASQGSAITVFFTGAGRTEPALADGGITPSPPPRPAAGRFSVYIGNNGVPTDEVAAVPGFIAGFFSARVRVPRLGYSSDTVPIYVSVSEPNTRFFAGSQALTVAVR